MDSITLKSILMVIQRTINSVDNRLLNHGEQVGYICLRMGLAMGYKQEQLLPLCTLAMMHDIGAYKVEERERMTEFEVELPHEHAVYGSLFVQHFGPLQHLSNVIFYHHWRYENRHNVINGRPVPPDAFLVHLADRVSVLYARYGQKLAEAVRVQLPNLAGTAFDPEHVEMLLQLTEQTDIIDKILDGSYLTEFYGFLDRAPLTTEQAVSYLCMLVYAIEFRSRSTVTHSVSVGSCTEQLAEFSGVPKSDRELLRHAALLHDVGKITTPVDILTKPGKLDATEMEIMRRHVVVTAEIITGTGLDQVKDIASNHHEKLNGKGYPRGLCEAELCTSSRIIAVADILTALLEPRYYKPALNKETILDIMSRIAEANEIDTEIFAVVQKNYDQITAEIENQQKLMLSQYDEIAQEYNQLLEEVYAVLDTSARAGMNTLIAA